MSQKDQILNYLKSGRSLNKMDALRLFGCMVLAQRIDDIEREIEVGRLKGWVLKREPLREHHGSMSYWMEPERKQCELFV